MAYLNQCYLSYYLRSGLDHDQVVFSNHQGRFQARDFRPMLMSLYDNDPLQFPFNWENFEKNGAPVCKWLIQFVVEYGKVEEDMFGMKEMKVDRRQTITLDSGRVVKSEWSPSAFEK